MVNNFISKYPITSICILVFVMLIPHLDILQVTIMEARNFITAREMLTDGNWLLTTMNGEPRYQKPPLPTWITAISMLMFGVKSVFGARLPAVIMIAVIGCYIFKLSEVTINNFKHSFLNALIGITSFYIIGIIIEAPWDIYSHAFMLIAIFNLFLLFEKENNYWKHTVLAGLFIGFSFLSKGPISMYALMLPFLLAYGFSFKYKYIKSKLFSVFSVLIISLIVGCWWYLYVRLEDPTTFTEVTKRETSNWSSYNVRPFYYYWSFFTQSGLWTIPAFVSLLYPYLKSRVSNLKAYRLSFFWTIFVVIFLSIVPEKKSRYLMPVLIPLAFNIGFYIEYLIRKFKVLRDKRETIPVYFNFGLVGLIGIVFPFLGFFIGPITGIFLVWFILSSLALFSIGVLIILNLSRKNINSVFYASILFVASILIFALPLSNIQEQAEYNPISNLKQNNSINNLKIYGFNFVAPEVIWQYGDKIPAIKINDSTYNFPKENKFGVLANGISPEDQSLLKKNYSIEHITTYNLNIANPDSRNYKERLMNHYYILTKK